MAGMEPESVDAIVTDPPYNLITNAKPGYGGGGATDTPAGRLARGFMGKVWDGDGVAFRVETWQAALRVAKPGAYLLAFGGTRTVHRLTVALEDAGWIIRDLLVWAYAQGFPKSRSSLKPAWEPIVLARKPGPLRELGIDECRIGTTRDVPASHSRTPNAIYGVLPPEGRPDSELDPSIGRWPANVILTDPIFDGGWDGVVGGGETTSGKMQPTPVRNHRFSTYGADAIAGYTTMETYGDTGTYSRFFLIPKAPTRERKVDGERSPHPTQKPEALIRHLVKLVTPRGGVVLDPFLGSGTLGVVCDGLGIEWVGIEREPEYVEWAQKRIAAKQPEWSAA